MQAHGFILPSRIIGVIVLLPAVVCAVLAIWFYKSTSNFLHSATS